MMPTPPLWQISLMPNWNEVLKEIQVSAQTYAAPLDHVRRKYLKQMFKKTDRNVIAYYSGWLQKPGLRSTSIGDGDKNGFMTTVHKLDRRKGLDLILHTPGGDLAATESIVHYLREMFGTDIRAFIPQISMSAGTMIACSCKQIIMGSHSNLGPIDPQFNGISAHGVIEEFDVALAEIKKDPTKIPLWQVIISKYHPTFIGDCRKAIDWAEKMVTDWLVSGMFSGDGDAVAKAKDIVTKLSSHSETKSHARHIPMSDLKAMGLKIDDLKDMPKDLQDTVLTIHHAYMHTFSHSLSVKVIENQMGVAMINQQPLQKAPNQT